MMGKGAGWMGTKGNGRATPSGGVSPVILAVKLVLNRQKARRFSFPFRFPKTYNLPAFSFLPISVLGAEPRVVLARSYPVH